jgi:hypothetical protein
MVVVIIIAILAAVASVGWGGYRRRTYATEAQMNIGILQSVMQTYKAETGKFYDLNCSNPASISCGAAGDFIASCGAGTCCEKYTWIGFRPENRMVRFRYRIDAGTALGSEPSWATAFITNPSLGWYAIEAIGDLKCSDGAETTYRAVNSQVGLIRKLNEYK